MSTFKITIIASPHFKNPVLIQTENYCKKEFENALKQYMYSWLWLKPEETNQIEKIQDLFFQKDKTFPLKIAGYKWEIDEIQAETGEPEEILENENEAENTEENQDVLEPTTETGKNTTELEVLENSEIETENLPKNEVELVPEPQTEEIKDKSTITVDNLEIKNFDQNNKKRRK